MTDDDIKRLIELRSEGPNLDYKAGFAWTKDNRDKKYELVRDLIALANTKDGGRVIFGVRDGDCELVGVATDIYESVDVSLGRAIELLDRAIVLSPTYAQALGYSAYCRALRPFHGYSADPARDFREASELARRALDADSEDPVGLRAAAITVVLVDRDYQAGWDLMDRSLAIDSNSAYSWNLRGWISMWAGEPEQAIPEFERAIRLSPYDPWISHYSLGMAFALNTSGQFEEGLRWARRAMQENPNWIACHRQLVGALALVRRLEEAREAARRHQAIDPTFTVRRWVETGPFRRTPNQERFFAALREAGLPG